MSLCANVSLDAATWIADGGFLLITYSLITCFYALGYICDRYFIISLEIFVQEFNIPRNVAASTFTAIGTSAPHVFISLIGLLSQKSPLGLTTIVGSALLNQLMLPALAIAYAKNGKVQFKPKILTREIVAHIVALLLLLWALGNKIVDADTFIRSQWTRCLEVTTLTSLVMLLGYAIYVVIVANYNRICVYLTGSPAVPPSHSQQSVVISQNPIIKPQDINHQYESEATKLSQTLEISSVVCDLDPNLMQACELGQEEEEYDRSQENAPDEISGDVLDIESQEPAEIDDMPDESSSIPSLAADESSLHPNTSISDHSGEVDIPSADESHTDDIRGTQRFDKSMASQRTVAVVPVPERVAAVSPVSIHRDVSDTSQRIRESFATTERVSIMEKIVRPDHWTFAYIVIFSNGWDLFNLPIRRMIDYSIPDVMRLENRDKYGRATIISIIWLGLLAEAIVRCIRVFGELFHTSLTILGLTVSAVGASAPAMWSSTIMAQLGHADGCISHGLGANTFIILGGLGERLPLCLYYYRRLPYP